MSASTSRLNEDGAAGSRALRPVTDSGMTQRVSIHQPSYWPWLGQLAKIAASDVYVCLDSVAAAKNENQYRNLFYCNGEAKYLTLPVNYRMGVRIDELQFTTDQWKLDHLNKLRNYYRKAPFFEEVFRKITPLYAAQGQSPVEFILTTMTFAFEVLALGVTIIRSSSFNVLSTKGDLVLGICKATGATQYVGGMGSYEYMKEVLGDFHTAGIDITWHKYSHPQYSQDPQYPFVPGLACLDLFFFQGFERARDLFQESIRQT
jgi:hypothetical protein